MKAMNMWSSFLNLEKVRRNSLSLRKSLSASIRFRYIAIFVEPWLKPIALGWNHGNTAEIQCQLARFVVLVSPIHQLPEAVRGN